MSDFPLSLGQVGTILFFGGFVVWTFRWVGRNLRAQIGESSARPKASPLSAIEIESVVARGLAQPAELFNMSPAQQRFLAETAASMDRIAPRPSQGAPPVDSAPPRTHCPACGVLVENLPQRTPWRCDCTACGAALVLRRDGPRFVISFTPRD